MALEVLYQINKAAQNMFANRVSTPVKINKKYKGDFI